MPVVEQALLTATGPVLLVYPGLLARYDQIPLLERLREACGRRDKAPGFIALIAADEQHHMPVLDGKPIPVILASEWVRIPEAWLQNVHRGGKQVPTSKEQEILFTGESPERPKNELLQGETNHGTDLQSFVAWKLPRMDWRSS